MDKPDLRSALIGAGIALLLILVVGVLTGGGARTLGPTVPAAPKAAP